MRNHNKVCSQGILAVIDGAGEIGKRLPVRREGNGAFYFSRKFRHYVVSRPDNNRIGLRRGQQQLRSITACREQTAHSRLAKGIAWIDHETRWNQKKHTAISKGMEMDTSIVVACVWAKTAAPRMTHAAGGAARRTEQDKTQDNILAQLGSLSEHAKL
ncbi:hypothetical protein B0H19DRAFT_1071201 [Mycena capillaripes]|nr:hypothetical protein B0H19DRAFT_1071201 [Mycena capillaripes]